MKDAVRTPYPIETSQVQIPTPDRSTATTVYDVDANILSKVGDE